MTGVLANGEGAALAGLVTYLIILMIPIFVAVLGLVNIRKGTPDGKRVGKAMFVLALLIVLVIVAFFVITAL